MEKDSTNILWKKLRYDIISNFLKDPQKPKQRLVYGKKGEKVKVIAIHSNTFIVENLQGNRFPVGAKELL